MLPHGPDVSVGARVKGVVEPGQDAVRADRFGTRKTAVRIVESGIFTWCWDTPLGLIVIAGASGGGGGGGGACCLEGPRLYLAGGGGGGQATTVQHQGVSYRAAGGDGGDGGGGGRLADGEPVAGSDGRGSHFGGGGNGGCGATVATPDPGPKVGNGGCGSKGFGGETLVVELTDLAAGDRLDVVVGAGGGAGGGGEGFENGGDADPGAAGWVLFVPLWQDGRS